MKNSRRCSGIAKFPTRSASFSSFRSQSANSHRGSLLALTQWVAAAPPSAFAESSTLYAETVDMLIARDFENPNAEEILAADLINCMGIRESLSVEYYLQEISYARYTEKKLIDGSLKLVILYHRWHAFLSAVAAQNRHSEVRDRLWPPDFLALITQKKQFALPPKVTRQVCKTSVSYQDFLQTSRVKPPKRENLRVNPPKRAFRTRRPPKAKREFNELVAAGFLPGQLQQLCEYPRGSTLPPPSIARRDFPAVRDGAGASLQLALSAAQPHHQESSLRALGQDMLAPSSGPSVDSRLRTWQTICDAWAQPCFPLTLDNVRRASASFKARRCLSAKQYFAIVCAYQQRELGIPIDPIIRQCIKGNLRSIERGLGPSRLKEAFPLPALRPLICPTDIEPFDSGRVAHAADVLVIGVWWMLREVELAAARVQHLQVHHTTATLTLPFSKTDCGGQMVSRAPWSVPACPRHTYFAHTTQLSGTAPAPDWLAVLGLH